MILLGIVGTPASGKSTVASYLQDKDAEWLNADLIARDVLHRPDVTARLVSHFGPEILDGENAINRSALAGRVFGDSDAQRTGLDFLESVVHPLTRAEINARLKQAAKKSVQVAMLDVPLLFESGWDRSCDVIWCIDAPVEARRQWASDRDWDAAELERRESNQMCIAEKKRLSNDIVSNDTTLADLHRKLDYLWDKLVTMRRAGSPSPDPSHCFTDRQ